MATTRSQSSRKQYRYQRLRPGSQQIRLLRSRYSVLYGMQYELHTFTLNEAPEYVALSYMWGPPTPTFNCIVHEDRSIRIRQNLHKFLSHYRDEGYLWVDQLCIDQSNVLERNHQVALMSKIYEGAAYVIAWLGLDSRASKVKPSDEEARFNLSKELTFDILADPYFSRLWVVQEFMLARSVDFMFEDGRLPALQLDQIIDLVSTGRTQFREKTAGFDRLVYYSHRQGLPLEGCLDLFCGNHCGDPRDKVYGMMGLVKTSQRLQIDYSKSTHEVYSDVILAFINEANTYEQPNYGIPEHTPGLREYMATSSLLTKAMLSRYFETSLLLSKEMEFTASELEALEKVINDVWRPETSDYFTGSWYTSITAMGFETVPTQLDANETPNQDAIDAMYPCIAKEKHARKPARFRPVGGRWWYDIDGRRRYYACYM
jgi:hypothetical protein